MASNSTIFAQDDKFWNNYLKGRPQAPEVFFDRIFSYHQAQGGTFGTVHDVGAGNGPYAPKLRSKFAHVIVSDIVARNIELAQARLGTDGFSYRAAKVEEAGDIQPGSVDMVFATNVMHFPDQRAAMNAIAQQLRPGGTFACATFGSARFYDVKLQNLWERVNYQGGRELLQRAEDPKQTIGVMSRTQGNVAPLDPKLFLPGAQRLGLNTMHGDIVTMLPPDFAQANNEPNHIGTQDKISITEEDGWSFEMDLDGVKEHMLSFPFVADYKSSFTDLFAELDHLLSGGAKASGVFPARVILATRRSE
ncbi:S-adenosyl-L-methionine-dependent methyltransferase [Lophiotrema nucula]|uniref:S-adenosyl-L-methionine-dependent methyltransferase n=1 Tax=Lophiotrema nucula TaxID=690887 RepID=A0A6A5YXR0_9PLEO|nr:S-adenosyl-L-methionine-dependent methyltransferase [Lophiotrema nucula]